MEKPLLHTEAVSALQASLLRTLAYFDVFGHPLTTKEVTRFGDGGLAPTTTVLAALGDLHQRGIVQQDGEHWGLSNTPRNGEARRADEQRANSRLPKALAVSSRIARFPFVRAVFISGSMSKGRLAVDGDIDFFIITEPGRLWVCRTMLVLYKKLFLLNSRRDFCVNYFLDTEHMAVEDRNRFTATEVVTLMPTYGNGITEKFFASNTWAFAQYPGARAPRSLEVNAGSGRRKRFIEKMLCGSFGAWLDHTAMSLTWRWWKWKFSDMDPRAFDLALRTRTYVSKHHPRNFQDRVLAAYTQRIVELEARTGASLA